MSVPESPQSTRGFGWVGLRPGLGGCPRGASWISDRISTKAMVPSATAASRRRRSGWVGAMEGFLTRRSAGLRGTTSPPALRTLQK